MPVKHAIDFNRGGDVSYQGLCGQDQNFPVGGSHCIEWDVKGKSRRTIVEGLTRAQNRDKSFNAVEPAELNQIYVLVSRWDRKRQQSRRFTGVRSSPGRGIAKAIADLIEHHWRVRLTTAVKQLCYSGWDLVMAPEGASPRGLEDTPGPVITWPDLGEALERYFKFTHSHIFTGIKPYSWSTIWLRPK